MPSGQYDFTCEQGATFEKRLRVTTDAGPLDFTGFGARMHVRPRIADDFPEVELTTENGRIVLSEGLIDLLIPANVTATIVKDGVYDLELVDTAGDVSRLLKGQFKLDQEVTR